MPELLAAFRSLMPAAAAAAPWPFIQGDLHTLAALALLALLCSLAAFILCWVEKDQLE